MGDFRSRGHPGAPWVHRHKPNPWFCGCCGGTRPTCPGLPANGIELPRIPDSRRPPAARAPPRTNLRCESLRLKPPRALAWGPPGKTYPSGPPEARRRPASEIRRPAIPGKKYHAGDSEARRRPDESWDFIIINKGSPDGLRASARAALPVSLAQNRILGRSSPHLPDRRAVLLFLLFVFVLFCCCCF